MRREPGDRSGAFPTQRRQRRVAGALGGIEQRRRGLERLGVARLRPTLDKGGQMLIPPKELWNCNPSGAFF